MAHNHVIPGSTPGSATNLKTHTATLIIGSTPICTRQGMEMPTKRFCGRRLVYLRRGIMGVLSCARSGCENIMCDRYSSEYGYICDECFNELCAKGSDTDIEEFMYSDKPETAPEPDNAYEKFNAIFEQCG